MMEIESTTLERLEVLVTDSQNPTLAPPAFAVALDANGQPTGWVNGAWQGTWDSATGRAIALTPRIGAAGDLVISQGASVSLWMRWTRNGDELPARRVAVLRVT